MKTSKKTITLCSSAYFYRDVLSTEKELKKLGFKVKIPFIARKMQRSNDFDVSKVRTWLNNPDDYKIKTKLMKQHFKKVIESDAILVLNHTKKDIEGYIGGNVLLEMLVAYLHKKPIFILNYVADELMLKEEILGLNPIFVENDLERVKI
ncbi:MAG: hypothetical protein Q8P13_04745 [bacterium]|nr:hypothetical protein [bacterium]